MSRSRIRRWFAAGIAGALFTAVSLLSAGAVGAADPGQPLVVPVGNNDPQSNIVVVAPPGTVNAGVAYNPVTNSGPAVNNGQVVINGSPYYWYSPYAIPVNLNAGLPYYQWVNANWVPYTGVFPGYYGYGYGYAAPYGCPLGCTAAGPIVGVTGGGAAVVTDVRGGFIDDYYVVDPKTGKFVESDVNGNPVTAVPRP
jgi:hypothetical protein